MQYTSEKDLLKGLRFWYLHFLALCLKRAQKPLFAMTCQTAKDVDILVIRLLT